MRRFLAVLFASLLALPVSAELPKNYIPFRTMLYQPVNTRVQADIFRFGGTAVTLGQKTMSASIPTVLASDQTAIPTNADILNTATLSTDWAGAETATPTASEVAGSTLKVRINNLNSIGFIFTTVATTGTYAFGGSMDGENWDVINCANGTTGNQAVRGVTTTTPAINTYFFCNIVSGLSWFRVRQTVHTGPSAVVKLNQTEARSYDTMWPVSSYRTLQEPQRFVAIGGTDYSTTCNGTGCFQALKTTSTPSLTTDVGAIVRPVMGAVAGPQALTAVCADPCQGAAAVSTSQVAVSLAGATGFNVSLTANAAATMTVKFEISFDPLGNDWYAVNTIDYGTGNRIPGSGLVNPTGSPRSFGVSTRPGALWGRVRVSAFTSGSATYVVSANSTGLDPQAYTGIPSFQIPGTGMFMIVGDGTTACNGTGCARGLAALNTTPTGTEYGLITRSTDGKAEDAPAVSGDVGGFQLGVRKDGSAQTTSADGDYAQFSVDAYGVAFSRIDHPNRISCNLTTTATTSTVITGCAAPGAGLSIYIVDISIYGGVADGITAASTIQSGTGGNCGTATAVRYYCQHGATAGCEAHFLIPIKTTTVHEVCILDAAVGTKFVTISGFIAP